jgi:hypothetical protein
VFFAGAVDATVVKCLGANRGRESARGPNTLMAGQMDLSSVFWLLIPGEKEARKEDQDR